jgi:DNA primase
MEKSTLINQVLEGEKGKGGRNEHLFFCPKCFHHKPKLSVNYEKNVFKCWVCEYAGSLDRLVQDFGTNAVRNAWGNLEGEPDPSPRCILAEAFDEDEEEECDLAVQLPKPFNTLTSFDKRHREAFEFLWRRGITRRDVLFYQMGWSNGKVIIPSFDAKGMLNCWIGRAIGSAHYTAVHPPKSRFIFNEMHMSWNQPVTLVEGVFDAIKADHNAVPLLGSYLGEDWLLLERLAAFRPRVYLALDPDAETKEKKIARLLLSYGIDVWKIRLNGVKDPGELTKKEMEERRKNAWKVTDQLSTELNQWN